MPREEKSYPPCASYPFGRNWIPLLFFGPFGIRWIDSKRSGKKTRWFDLASSLFLAALLALPGGTQANPEADVIAPGGWRVPVAVGCPAATGPVVPEAAAMDTIGAT